MTWDDLSRELDAWGEAGRTASFWWRDDDAAALVPALRRLLDLADAPLTLAVIPAAAEAMTLPDHVSVVPHGYAHRNRAGTGQKKCEFPPNEDRATMLDELKRGVLALRQMHARHFRPVLVPPWNRIDHALLPLLPRIGLHGISTFGARDAGMAAPGLFRVNTHVDVIDWHGGRGFVGEAAALGSLVRHLVARRSAVVDAGEPTGLLTHHLQHDEATWAFVGTLIRYTSAHPAARWLDVDAAFGAAA